MYPCGNLSNAAQGMHDLLHGMMNQWKWHENLIPGSSTIHLSIALLSIIRRPSQWSIWQCHQQFIRRNHGRPFASSTEQRGVLVQGGVFGVWRKTFDELRLKGPPLLLVQYEFAGNALRETHRDARLSEHAKNLMYILRAKDPNKCDMTGADACMAAPHIHAMWGGRSGIPSPNFRGWEERYMDTAWQYMVYCLCYAGGQ